MKFRSLNKLFNKINTNISKKLIYKKTKNKILSLNYPKKKLVINTLKKISKNKMIHMQLNFKKKFYKKNFKKKWYKKKQKKQIKSNLIYKNKIYR